MSSQPIVSVLMTAFNRQQLIAESIESVLGSTLKDFELIIVDDCSVDNTIEIAKGYEAKDNRIKVHSNDKNLGDYPNRNKAATYATGKYLKYLDSDDAIYPYGLEMMVNSMEMFPEAGFGLSAIPDPKRKYPVCLTPKEIFLEHFSGYKHFDRAPGSGIIRRDVFEKEGGFSGERLVGDLEFWLRLGAKYQMVKFPYNLYWYRQHENQEISSVYATEVYSVRTGRLIEKALNNPMCPLNEDEKRKIKSALKSKVKKEKLLRISKDILNPFFRG